MPRDYIFVSYSHKDDEWLERLRVFLKAFPWGQSYKAGGRLWADPYIQTGERWRRQIGDGLGRARIGVLLISQDFLASDFIRTDELPPLLDAAQADALTLVCVPVRTSVVDLSHPALLEYQWTRPYDQPLDLLGPAEREAALAQVFRQLFQIAQAAGLTEPPAPAASAAGPIPALESRPVASFVAPGGALGALHGVPEQRPHHIPQVDVRDTIRTALLSGTRSTVGVTGTNAGDSTSRVGVFGQGGLGKTVAAIDLVHDETVRRAFDDGVYWLTLGQAPDLASLQATLIQYLTNAPAVVDSVPAGSARLRELLSGRACLIVLDDVWRYEHAAAFDVVGERSRLLITTRDASVLTALGATDVGMDVLSKAHALALLAKWTGQPLDAVPPEGHTLVTRCGYLPLAISVAGAMVRDGTAWRDVLAALDAGNVRFLDHPYASVFSSLRLSVEALPADVRARYLELAIVPEDVAMPVRVINRLWGHTGGLKEYECGRLIADLERKALLYVEGDGDDRHIRFHDLQRDFLELTVDDVHGLHGRLLDAFATLLEPAPAESPRAWWTLPANERYLWLNVGHHLLKASRDDELLALLYEYDWIDAKLRATDVTALLADYDLVPGDARARVLRDTLRLSAHVIAHDPAQLASQLHGRLLSFNDPEVARLLTAARARQAGRTWLRPLAPTLGRPGGPLMRTLSGHADSVISVAVSRDGRYVVSGSWDGTVRVWDFTTAACLQTIQGHERWVRNVAISDDGQRILSTGSEGSMKLWMWATATMLWTCHSDPPSGGVVVIPDGTRLLAAGHQTELMDMATGATLETVASIRAPVATTPDGRRLVGCTAPHAISVVDPVTSTTIATLTGHTSTITALATTPDGTRLLSTSSDRSVRVWNLETGALLWTLLGHLDDVTGVAVTRDGRRAVSSSYDKTVRVWDLDTGVAIATLDGHASRVEAVTVTPDGRHAISASWDNTLKVWDLTVSPTPQPLAHHNGSVTALAVAPDGRHAVSGAADRTVRVWDLNDGAALHTLEGHADEVIGVAILADGRTVASGALDGDIRVWDLATGAPLRTLSGHASGIVDLERVGAGPCIISASSDHTLRVWNTETGETRHVLEGHTGRLSAVAVAPDGHRALSAADDRTVRLWDLVTGNPLRRLECDSEIGGLAIAADGERALVTTNDGAIIAYEMATGDALETATDRAGNVRTAALTPDGRVALATNRNHVINAWDMDTGSLSVTLRGHRSAINGVAAGGSGLVVSISADTTARLWNLTTGQLVATFTANGYLYHMAVGRDDRTIVIGDSLGRVHVLRIEH